MMMRDDVEIPEELEVLALEDRDDLDEEARSALLATETGSDLKAAADRGDAFRELLGWHDALVERLTNLRGGDENAREGIEAALTALGDCMGRAWAALDLEGRWIGILLRRTI